MKYFRNPITGQRYKSENGFIKYAKSSGDDSGGYYTSPSNEIPPPPEPEPVRNPNPFEKE